MHHGATTGRRVPRCTTVKLRQVVTQWTADQRGTVRTLQVWVSATSAANLDALSGEALRAPQGRCNGVAPALEGPRPETLIQVADIEQEPINP